MSKRLLWGIIIILLVTNTASLIYLTGNKGQSIDELEDGSDIPKKVATIGDKGISAEDWVAGLRDEHGEEYLKEIINREVVSQLAKENNLTLNEKLINRELAMIETTVGPMTDDEREQKRKEWKSSIEYEWLLQELLTRDVVVDESEINEFFLNDNEQFDFPKYYQLSQIIVNDQNTANTIISELEDGASFADLAEEYSIDENTNNQGGYLGYFTEGHTYLQSIYYSQLAIMEPGTFSSPFQTGDGTVIVYLHHVLPEITLEFEDVKHHIRRLLAKEQLPMNPSAEVLWDEVGVDWVYKP